ncbi:MAG: hypothetical protein LBM66_00830, partial [Bifidobacteriaceae bacterium]|nr:hypothetical protein [Bifidobacteriaceae bacterium]
PTGTPSSTTTPNPNETTAPKTKGSIAGKVTDNLTGQGATGWVTAVKVLPDPTNKCSTYCYQDAGTVAIGTGGEYTLKDLDPGTYAVVASVPGRMQAWLGTSSVKWGMFNAAAGFNPPTNFAQVTVTDTAITGKDITASSAAASITGTLKDASLYKGTFVATPGKKYDAKQATTVYTLGDQFFAVGLQPGRVNVEFSAPVYTNGQVTCPTETTPSGATACPSVAQAGKVSWAWGEQTLSSGQQGSLALTAQTGDETQDAYPVVFGTIKTGKTLSVKGMDAYAAAGYTVKYIWTDQNGKHFKTTKNYKQTKSRAGSMAYVEVRVSKAGAQTKVFRAGPWTGMLLRKTAKTLSASSKGTLELRQSATTGTLNSVGTGKSSPCFKGDPTKPYKGQVCELEWHVNGVIVERDSVFPGHAASGNYHPTAQQKGSGQTAYLVAMIRVPGYGKYTLRSQSVTL